jgi:antitoxin component of MazEF toxin-antitoxin module
MDMEAIIIIQYNDNKGIIESVPLNVIYNLNEMLDKITENNIHHSIDTGLPIGNEIW